MELKAFTKIIWDHYKKYGRDLPWRHDASTYRVVVSEIMLQQTQALRVTKKFESFLKKFPDWNSLARASTSEVLQEWQGLGYNRRALNLQRLAQTIKGNLPDTYEKLLELPGIGPNTAGSILAFAFNIPCPFIETNIRTVFIHFFFKNSRGKVHDKKLMPLIERTLDRTRPREWYYALMDYGCYLKQTETNPSRRSAHHVKQSRFKGSNRELRSHILKLILKKKSSQKEIMGAFPDKKPETILKNISDLIKEGFLELQGYIYTIPTSKVSSGKN
jgi:A/G-specific adenine glycosylase